MILISRKFIVLIPFLIVQYDNIFQEAIGGNNNLLNNECDCILIFTKLETLSWDLARNYPALKLDKINDEVERIKQFVDNVLSGIRNQTDAMGSLNSAAMAVQEALEAMMQAGSGGNPGGLMQQLQALAGQQQSLNARTKSMEAAAQAARLAAEQAAIQKSLEQLNREAQRAGEGDRLLPLFEREVPCGG